MYDLIIIGGGPTGINCAIEAKKKGLNYIVLEKGTLVNSLYNFPTNMTFFSTSKKLEIGDVPFISHVDKPTRKEALEYYRRLTQAYDLNINFYEGVNNMKALENKDGYTITTSKDVYNTYSVIIATGYYDTPRMLNVPGENLAKVFHYYNDPHPFVGQDILVVGAANSACDVALETHYKGARVTMAIRGESIYEKVKYWIKPNIENRIKEGSIKAYFNTTIKEIRPTEVVLNTSEEQITIKNDFVLAMTGYQPNYEFIRSLGVEIPDEGQRIPVYNKETLETNLPNVYLAGVVCAGMQTSKLFIENTRNHGEVIINAILNKNEVVN